ncbi:EAL domain-containing protein [Enterobacteriaceae bacterium C34A]
MVPFIQPVVRDNKIDSIIVLSRRLKIEVVAEGVENSEQLSLLKDKGVHIFHGYLFSRPVTLHEFCVQI